MMNSENKKGPNHQTVETEARQFCAKPFVQSHISFNHSLSCVNLLALLVCLAAKLAFTFTDIKMEWIFGSGTRCGRAI